MEQGKYKNQPCHEGHPRNGVYLPHTSASPAVAAAFLHLLRGRRYPLASFASLAVLHCLSLPFLLEPPSSASYAARAAAPPQSSPEKKHDIAL
ncbi:hypothetical protein PVAP13_2KG448105 [Panicum virgatum]|uniref:Uncharacterized protein n=1 Tax=Panicum virgatum TaxID=38727 RepID=A0A8T0W8H3_PANVG|nr:hypothetical protein PVAP13_2KG448105 [Panicum virgatum]